MIQLSIVMPCLNEEKTIGICIEKANEFFKKNKIIGEIIVGDNGSNDNSIKIAESLGASIIHISKKGYGAALKGAIHAARGKYIIMGDSDDSYNFLEVSGIFFKLIEGYDFVIGNRFQGGIQPGAMPWKNRYIGNPILTWIGRMLFDIPCRDFHCGLRGFRKEAYSQLSLLSDGMEFASEMLIKAKLSKLKITEVPIVLYPDGRGKSSHLRPWKDGWKHLVLMFLHAPAWSFSYPGFIFCLLGMLFSCLLLRGPLFLGNISLDLGSLLASFSFLCMGMQALTFTLITKSYASENGIFYQRSFVDEAIKKIYTFERFLLTAVILIIGGFLIGLFSLLQWIEKDFGPMNASILLRYLLLACFMVILGAQLAFSALFVEMQKIATK